MKIVVRNLSFGYTGERLFDNLNADLDGAGGALVILGPSGSGKTTLLKLLGGLLKPQGGEVSFTGDSAGAGQDAAPVSSQTAFIFQEPRLLPWMTVLENVRLPLEKLFGKEEARERAKLFLRLVSLEDKAGSFPGELSGGQAQRVSMARAFAWPAPALLMDEPFQSLDIPLRISLMETFLSLREKEKRLFVAVTHDPREAVYLGGRILVLGKPPAGIVLDRTVDLESGDRIYGSTAAGELERELIEVLRISQSTTTTKGGGLSGGP